MTRTSLEWARGIALSYRSRLHAADPAACAELDAAALKLGQGWVTPVAIPEWADNEEVLDAELTPADIEHYWRIPAVTIRAWASKGLLEKRAKPDGTPVYRLGDVFDCQARRAAVGR